jgi:hypothetical protein
MKLLDLLVFYMGIYGISWSIIYARPLQPLINIFRNFKHLDDLLECIVCTSFWVAIPFTYLYFKQELWYTQVLLLFSSVTFTWVLAHFLDDI